MEVWDEEISFTENCFGERWKVQNPGTKPLVRSLSYLKWVGTRSRAGGEAGGGRGELIL